MTQQSGAVPVITTLRSQLGVLPWDLEKVSLTTAHRSTLALLTLRIRPVRIIRVMGVINVTWAAAPRTAADTAPPPGESPRYI